jgi:formate dehydrogenase major subunit
MTSTGDYFGLPWPCYGNAKIKHPGTPLLYDTHKHPMDGGHAFRALFGVEKDGVNLLAEDGVHNKGSDITTGYPQFDHVLLKKLGWWDELTDAGEGGLPRARPGRTTSRAAFSASPMKHGCTPFGNAKARAVVWNWPDAIPQHREPLFSPKPELVEKYPDPRRRQGAVAACRPCSSRCSSRRSRTRPQEVPADPDQRPPGGVRGLAARRRARTRGSPS